LQAHLRKVRRENPNPLYVTNRKSGQREKERGKGGRSFPQRGTVPKKKAQSKKEPSAETLQKQTGGGKKKGTKAH